MHAINDNRIMHNQHYCVLYPTITAITYCAFLEEVSQGKDGWIEHEYVDE